MQSDKLASVATDALEELKAQEVRLMDVRKITTIADYVIVASGTSDRHVKSLADSVIEASKAAGERPLGVEGDQGGEWVLVDLGDVVVHIMLPRVRDFYNIEKLWDISADEKLRKDAAGD